MKKQIVIIEPSGVPGNVFSRFMGLPLMGPLYLGGILQMKGHSVRLINENILGRHVNLTELDADVCCVSALTSTVERGYEIIRQYKGIRPKGLSIIGGVHASFLPEEALHYADVVVIGEGEKVIADIIEHPNFGQAVYGTRIQNLDDLPIPDLKMLTGSAKVPVTPIMTSRGCPYDCTFCTVTQMFGHRYRMHSVDRVIEELSRVDKKVVFFYDDNFAASPTRTAKILETMLSKGIKLKWSAQVRSDLAKFPDLVSLMARAGCTRVYVGFESIDDNSLASMNKRQTKADIIHAIETFHRFGIAIHGMFILGNDEDPPNIGMDTVKFCKKYKMDSVQFLILTPFPGTTLFARMSEEGRILHKRWAYYDAMHTVFKPHSGTAMDIQEQMMACFEEFYSLSSAFVDGLNAISEGIKKLPSMIRGNARLMNLISAFTKIGARKIVRQWLNANRDYLAWLARVSVKG